MKIDQAISINGSLPPMSSPNIPHINELWYDNSGLCEPDNDDFQAWRDSLSYVRGDGICDINPGIALTTTDTTIFDDSK